MFIDSDLKTWNPRAMLTANVGVTVPNGCLTIAGDAKGDQFVVHQLASGDWTVTGLGGTKINGQKSGTFSDVDCITITTLGGKDVVGVAGGVLSGPLCINTGSGDDVVALAGLTVGSVNVNTGAGNDALIVAGLTTPSDSTIDGTNFTPASVTSSSPSVSFNTGDGINIVLLADIKTENLSLTTGKGSDFVGLAGVSVDECLSVDTGGGADMLGIIDCSASLAKLSNGSQPGDILATGQNRFGSTTSNFKTTLNINPLVKTLNSEFKSVQKAILTALDGFVSIPGLNI